MAENKNTYWTRLARIPTMQTLFEEKLNMQAEQFETSISNSFPKSGMTRDEIEQELKQLRSQDADPRSTFPDRWLNDRGLLLDDGTFEVAKAAHLAFFTKGNNYPTVVKFERDLIQMALSLFHAGKDATGAVTSGGSESLFLATAAALANAKERRPHIARSEIIIPQTGYPTFEKYERYLGYTIRRVPVDANFRADVSAMSEAVSENTVMMLASMPSWSHGVCDPVRELAEIASKHGIWLHVDACVGGFLAPFVRELGRDVPEFDFRVPGVSSISADFHKYGYSGKGVSGVFYRNKVARHQPFIFDTWAAGLYRSPVLTGTRNGGAIASAWAVMRYLGRDGYLSRAGQILKLRDAILSFVERCPGLKIVGGAELNVVGIGSDYSDVYSIASKMKDYGWKINLLKEPGAIQLVLGPLRDEYISLLVHDLEKAVEAVQCEDFRAPSPAVVYSDELTD
ncbi:MAG: aspartate aminotransferase family protein [Mesorhizobium sp.]|nr:MAG: aspartate aminotransferase family protein [Mesorhizobium sp.]